MPTSVKPVVANDEKSKFFTFLAKVTYGKPRNVKGLILFF